MGRSLTTWAVRHERSGDHDAVDRVVRAAFGDSGDKVVGLVHRIRASANSIPELAVVAEDDTGVIGHVMLSWVGLEGGARDRILDLTPMSVRPDRQLRGVGASLVHEILGLAESTGEPMVVVEGVPEYYPRFGFERASALGFVPPSPNIPDRAFMVKCFAGFTPEMAGRVVYPPAFDGLAD